MCACTSGGHHHLSTLQQLPAAVEGRQLLYHRHQSLPAGVYQNTAVIRTMAIQTPQQGIFSSTPGRTVAVVHTYMRKAKQHPLGIVFMKITE